MLVRALLVLLLILNVGATTWWIAHDSPPPPASPPPPPGVARLQLVSERTSTPPPAPTPEPPVTATSATAEVAAAAVPVCFSLGPFVDRTAADTALARVRPLVERASVRTPVAQASARGWRVFLPPLPSAEEAQATAARITAAGFSDLLVVRDGAEVNSIALGRYRNEAGARSRAQALTAAGFAAQVQPLDATPADNAPLWLEARAAAGFDPARAQAAARAAQHRPLDCASLR